MLTTSDIDVSDDDSSYKIWRDTWIFFSKAETSPFYRPYFLELDCCEHIIKQFSWPTLTVFIVTASSAWLPSRASEVSSRNLEQKLSSAL